MPLQLPPMPNFNVQQPPPFDPLAQQQKQATLSGMVDENALRRQLAPLNVQEAQQRVQQGQLQNQQTQMNLASQQALMTAVASGALNKHVSDDTGGSGPVFDAQGAFNDLVTKYHVLPEHAGQLISSLQTADKNTAEIRKNNSEAAKNYLDARAKAHEQMAEDIDAAFQAGPEAYAALQQRYAKNPPQGIDSADLQHFQQSDYSHGQALVGLLNLNGRIEEIQNKRFEQGGAAAKGQQAARAATAPTTTQLTNAVTALSTYTLIPPNMRMAFAKEMQGAPDWDTLQKVQGRADSANESFQRSADARAQAGAMKDVGLQNLVAGKLVAEDQKLGSALDQTGGIRGLLDMSRGGNQAATNAALTRFAEHEIVEGGVKRMNQLEYENLATKLGSYGRKFQSWVDGGFKGQMPAATNSEIHDILDAEDQALYSAHDRNVGYITDRYAGTQPNAAVGQPRRNGTAATLPQGSGKAIDKATAMQFYQAAGNDPNKARQLAIQNGWQVPKAQ